MILVAATACKSTDDPPAKSAAEPGPTAEVSSRVLDLAGIGEMKKVADATNESLATRTEEADRIVVLDPWSDSVLFESRAQKDIAPLQRALSITPPENWFHCMCLGGPAIRFFRGEGLLVEVTLHHGKSIRTSIWSSDAQLSAPERLVAWFDARGMPGPREELEEGERAAEEDARTWGRWTAGVPASLQALWQKDGARIRGTGINGDLAPWREALAREIDDPGERILSLLAWLGHGKGPWQSGYATYEMLPAQLLHEYPVVTIYETVENAELREAHLEGAARLFAMNVNGWRSFPDPALLTAELKMKLLRHGLNSKSSGNRDLARRAFGAGP